MDTTITLRNQPTTRQMHRAIELAQIAARQHPELRDRLCRALTLFARGAVRRLGDRAWAVAASGGNTTYLVRRDTRHTCTCPDFQHRWRCCKHILAVRMFERTFDLDDPPPPPPAASCRRCGAPRASARRGDTCGRCAFSDLFGDGAEAWAPAPVPTPQVQSIRGTAWFRVSDPTLDATPAAWWIVTYRDDLQLCDCPDARGGHCAHLAAVAEWLEAEYERARAQH